MAGRLHLAGGDQEFQPFGPVAARDTIEMLNQINGVRELLRYQRAAKQTAVDLAVPHTLSLTFIPKWLTALERDFAPINSRLMALNVHDAVLQLVEGGCDLLLCYHHPQQPVQLDPSRYDVLVLGHETLRPYARADTSGQPEHRLPGKRDEPLPYLAYARNAYLGRMVDLILVDAGTTPNLDKRYETDMAEGLKMMTLEGHGIAFLPESAVGRELRQGQLACADDTGKWEIEMEIRLYRERPSIARPGKEVVDRLWAFLARGDRT